MKHEEFCSLFNVYETTVRNLLQFPSRHTQEQKDGARVAIIRAWQAARTPAADSSAGASGDAQPAKDSGDAQSVRDAVDWRELLDAVTREVDDRQYSKTWRKIENAPGHCHEVPAVWDERNGLKSGKPCAWCLTWNAAREALARIAPVTVDSSARDAWISVSDRLPDQNQVVLVYRPDAHFLPACDPNIDCRCYFGSGVFNGIHEVTHWHPLPAPPQKPVSDEVKP